MLCFLQVHACMELQVANATVHVCNLAHKQFFTYVIVQKAHLSITLVPNNVMKGFTSTITLQCKS
jgi:hypothetical protein